MLSFKIVCRDILQCRLASALSSTQNHPNDDPPWTEETNDAMKYMIWMLPVITHAWKKKKFDGYNDFIVNVSITADSVSTGNTQMMHNRAIQLVYSIVVATTTAASTSSSFHEIQMQTTSIVVKLTFIICLARI